MKPDVNQQGTLNIQARILKILGKIINHRTLDIGRILGASTIFYFHIGLSGGFPFSAFGQMAVDYFIIIAGISYILFSKSKISMSSGYLIYMKKRLASLFPMFLMANLIIFLGSFLFTSSLGRPFRFIELLASATGISQYLGWKYMSNVMWFMPFIIQVYFLLPLIDWIAHRINLVVLVFAAFGVSCLLSQTVPMFIHIEHEDWLCKNWSPIFRLPEVCAGIILGRIVLSQSCLGEGFFAIAALGVLYLLVNMLNPVKIFPYYYMPWQGYMVPAVLFGISALLSPLLQNVNMKILRLLGLASFPFFLLHAAPLIAIGRHFQNQPFVLLIYFFFSWFAAVALTLFLGQIQKTLVPADSRRL